MVDRGCAAVWVTFVDELPTLGEATVSMVAGVHPDDPRSAPTRSRASRPMAAPMRGHSPRNTAFLRTAEGAHPPMKVFLMDRGPRLDPERAAAGTRRRAGAGSRAVAASRVMAAGDASCSRWRSGRCCQLRAIPRRSVYRQEVLTDCLEQPTVVRELYALAGRGAGDETGRPLLLVSRFARPVLQKSLGMLGAARRRARAVRRLADENASGFDSRGSRGFSPLCARSSTRSISGWSQTTCTHSDSAAARF